MSGDFLPYAKQEVTADDIQAVVNALQSPIITRGQETASLEQDFAQACGADYAVTFNSGSTALEAAYHAGQVGPQDRVLTTPVTFVSSISGALRLGARIVFIDVDPSTALLDEEQLRVNLEITPSRGKTVLVPVHYAGAPHDMERIESWIKEPDCLIIEDAAHALGATYPTGEKVVSCTYSQMTVFSLHPAKHITTGEGGVVTTNDPELYRSLLFYRNNYLDRDPESVGRALEPWEYEIRNVSGNYHMTEMQAALGRSQFTRLDAIVEKRRALVACYRAALQGVEHISTLEPDLDALSSHHLFVALIDFDAVGIKRGELMHRLKEKGIGSQVHYIPLYRQPLFAENSPCELAEFFPGAEAFYERCLSLPLYPAMTEEDVQRVVMELKNVIAAAV